MDSRLSKDVDRWNAFISYRRLPMELPCRRNIGAPSNPRRDAGFRHGVEAVAARLNDDAGTDLDVNGQLSRIDQESVRHDYTRNRTREPAEQTMNTVQSTAREAIGRGGRIARLTRAPRDPCPPKIVRCPVGAVSNTEH